MKAEQILDHVKDLPSPPHVACKLMELLRSSVKNNQEVVQIIQHDAAITAKLLKTCNSAFWARGEPLGSVDAALMRLGYQEVLRIVTAVSVGSSLARENKGYGVSAKELWHHSVVAAIATQKLAGMVKKPMIDPSLAFTAGLVHDIGKIVLSQSLLPQVDAVRGCVEKDGKSMLEAESEVLGVTHAEIGGCLLARWKLPPMVVEAVQNHHKPPLGNGGPALSAIVHVANGCAHCIGSSYGWDSMATRMEAGALEALGLRPEEMERTIIFLHGEEERINGFTAIA